jgi:hypothetical protein
VLTVCIPESIKNGIKLADEKIGILMEKTELQTESLEGMKIINGQLREQMKHQAEQITTIQNTVNVLIEHVKSTKEYKTDKMIRELPNSVGVKE